LILIVDEAHVSNVAVDPRRQRHGIGRRLMLELCTAARLRGCVSLSLEVRVTNVAAQELYRSFGFAPAGVRKLYYEGAVDAIVMWCHDVDGPEFAARLAQIAESIAAAAS
jgi:ribosomal-protein-alanine N-acetyltransferase